MRKFKRLVEVLIIQSQAQLELNKLMAEKIAILEMKLEEKQLSTEVIHRSYPQGTNYATVRRFHAYDTQELRHS